jgi:hypothetical protein
MAWQKFSHPQVVCNCNKTNQEGGGSAVCWRSQMKKKLKMNIKTSFFYVMSEV